MDFSLSDEQVALRDTVRRFAQAELVPGHWWQLAAATIFMASFVTAFSLFTDALRAALDPKLR